MSSMEPLCQMLLRAASSYRHMGETIAASSRDEETRAFIIRCVESIRNGSVSVQEVDLLKTTFSPPSDYLDQDGSLSRRQAILEEINVHFPRT